MNSNGPTGHTEDELFEKMAKAVQEGDEAAISALMAEEQPEPALEQPDPGNNQEPTAPDTTTDPQLQEDPKPQNPTPEDPLSGLDEKAKEYIKTLKEERDALDRRVRSELGRVPNLQRELANTKRQIEELTRKLQEPQPTATPKAPAPKQGKIAEKLAQLKEIDPALAEIFEAYADEVINPLRENLSNEIKEVKSIFASKEEEALWMSEKAKLLERFPQADEIFRLPLYREWKETLTPSQRALASSIYADDVSVALEQFARYAAVYQPELVTPVEKQAPTPAAPTPAPATPAAKVTEERNKRLYARAPGTSAPTPKFGDGLPETPEELHEYYKKKIRAGEM